MAGVTRAAILTVSDSRAAGEGADESGARLAAFAEGIDAQVNARKVVPDEQPAIEEALRELCDGGKSDLVLTTGGTGFAARDVTPEATRAVIEREAPGIAEAMRLASREHTELWMVSRGVVGVRGRTLIVNFPGAPKSIGEVGPAIAPALRHAVKLLRDEEH